MRPECAPHHGSPYRARAAAFGLLPILLLPSAASTPGPTLPHNPQPPEQAPKKIALIVAIGNYAPVTGWGPLATANDEKAIRDALVRQGFRDGDIQTIADDRATAPAIIAAFRNSLIQRAEPGGIAVFHYSGHGHRITDNNGDEPDGYDEVLVGFDAPRRPPPSYKGQKHVRDDQLNDLVRDLRQAVGPTGDVVISLDSCYSGSAARSVFATARTRGDLTPIGLPQDGRTGRDLAGGFDEVPAGPVAASAAPYVVISAARHDELAWETSGSDNKAMGSLSLALSKALNRADTATTYRALFDDLRRTMAAAVINTPQIEGVPDREILGGKAVTQESFYTIKSYDPPTRRARLAHGSLAGLFGGTRVAVHPAGTVTPRPEEAIATGTVVVADPTESLVELVNVVDPARVASGWMFVTERSFGTLRAVVKIDSPAGAAWAAPVIKALAAQPFVSVSQDSALPDFIVAQETLPPGEIFLRAAGDGRVLLGPLAADDPQVPKLIAERVKDATNNRYLRSLSMTAPGINASFEILACQLACSETPLGPKCDCAANLDERLVRPPGADLTLAVGDGFRIRLRNRGTESVYISVLDLEANGRISLLWPPFEHSGDDNRLLPGADFTVARPWRITPPAGLEVFKLVASLQQVDFRPITSRRFPKTGSRGPLDNLFLEAFEGARAEATLPVSSVHTQDITVRIVDKRTP